jgi:hypothetical protein
MQCVRHAQDEEKQEQRRSNTHGELPFGAGGRQFIPGSMYLDTSAADLDGRPEARWVGGKWKIKNGRDHDFGSIQLH